MGVVDLLETVQVHRDHRERTLKRPGGLQFALQAVEEVAAVEKLRQVILHRQLLQLHVVHEEAEAQPLLQVHGHADGARGGREAEDAEGCHHDGLGQKRS